MHLIIPNEPNQMMTLNIMANFPFLRVALGGRHRFYWLAQALGIPLTSLSLGLPQVGADLIRPACESSSARLSFPVPAGSSHVLVHLPLVLPGTPFSFSLLEEF